MVVSTTSLQRIRSSTFSLLSFFLSPSGFSGNKEGNNLRGEGSCLFLGTISKVTRGITTKQQNILESYYKYSNKTSGSAITPLSYVLLCYTFTLLLRYCFERFIIFFESLRCFTRYSGTRHSMPNFIRKTFKRSYK
jgi:hypothetical protein